MLHGRSKWHRNGYCSFLSIKLYSLHRATASMQFIKAPLIFCPAKNRKIIGVLSFPAPGRHLIRTSSLPPYGVASHQNSLNDQ
jgi:hypothetical protein